jgi:hypothetical protein
VTLVHIAAKLECIAAGVGKLRDGERYADALSALILEIEIAARREQDAVGR